MRSLKHLFVNNQQWAQAIKSRDPDFFMKLSSQQKPQYLWVGCSDSRVPANEIVGLLPGEMFVHRNVANVVIHTDLNCQSVIQYAVDVLKVKHIIVCGHYGCGGVAAALEEQQHGLIDSWLRSIKDIYHANADQFAGLNGQQCVDRLCELNVRTQVANVAHSTTVQNAWARGQSLEVHGWIYSVKDGLLRDLDTTIGGIEQIAGSYRVVPSPE